MTADDLRNYFNKFGEVVDVFIPKPFRAFAFVTFADPEVAQSLCGEDHIIKNASVHVSNAAPKNVGDKSGMGGSRLASSSYGGGWGQQHSKPGSLGGSSSQGSMGNMMGNLNLGGPFQLNPAMMAAAQAALTQGGWGMLGNMGNQGSNQGGGGPGSTSSGDGGPGPGPQNMSSSQFGSIGGSGSSAGGNSFLPWNGTQGQDTGTQGGWGHQAKSGWN